MIKAKKSITNLKPYINGSHNAELIKNHKKIIKLDSNEATIAPSSKVIAAIMQYLQNGPINWYPDVESTELCQALSEYTQLPTEYIATFNGSDHALETIARTFLSYGNTVISPIPTYDHFRVYVESCDASMTDITDVTSENLIPKITDALTPKTKMVYLVNPNNPMGTLLTKEAIYKAIKTFPNLLFVVDEAYFEFCGTTMADLVTCTHNLIVTRSFSKAFGLASLRCGYLLTHPLIGSQIAKIRVGKNINALAQVAAKAALNDLESMTRYVDEVNATKEWLLEKLTDLNLEVCNTPANFLLVKVARPDQVMNYLESQNIYVRDRSHITQLKGFLRITVGDQLLMKRFWRTFEKTPQDFLFNNEINSKFQEPNHKEIPSSKQQVPNPVLNI